MPSTIALACQSDPDLWFSEEPLVKEIAKNGCNSCPLKDECLSVATRFQEKHGIWGGVDFSDPSERVESEEDALVLCRAKRHWRKKGENCYSCRRESQKKYYKKNSKEINRKNEARKPPYKRLQFGDSCKEGHVLVPDNVIIRSNDKALMCKKCTRSRRARIPKVA